MSKQLDFVDRHGRVSLTFTKNLAGLSVLAEQDSYSDPGHPLMIVTNLTAEEARKLKEFLHD